MRIVIDGFVVGEIPAWNPRLNLFHAGPERGYVNELVISCKGNIYIYEFIILYEIGLLIKMNVVKNIVPKKLLHDVFRYYMTYYFYHTYREITKECGRTN